MSEPFGTFAPYYDRLYWDKDYRAEARWLQEVFAEHGMTGNRILDLGCGTGTRAFELTTLGYDVLGVESCVQMADVARAKGVMTAIADARAYDTQFVFDAAACLFHVLSYQRTREDLMAVLRTASRHLRAGGLFVFDFWYGPAVLGEPPQTRVKWVFPPSGGKLIRLAQPHVHTDLNQVDIVYTLLVCLSPDERYQELSETHRLRYWFAPELRSAVKMCGFEILKEHLSLDTYDGKMVARRV